MEWIRHNLWPFLVSHWEPITATLAILSAVFYGPINVLQAYEWYMYRWFDRKVEDYLRESVTAEKLTMHGPKRWAIPKSKTDIAEATGLSERRVSGSLVRLSRKRSVVADGNNWKIAT